MQVGFHVQFSLSDFNQNWNMLTVFSKMFIHKRAYKAVRLVSRCYMRNNTHKAIKLIFATFRRKSAKTELWEKERTEVRPIFLRFVT